MSQSNDIPEDRASLLSVKSASPTPGTITKLVKRLHLLTLQLLPVEVDPDTITKPTSRVITPQVVSAYIAAAGDFVEALPYCLLRARRDFMYEANHNPADYDENYGRAIACEVLARRVVHKAPKDRMTSIMSSRFKLEETDGDTSDMTSALELAIDTHCTIFLSSSEAQDVINALWCGDWVQKDNGDHDIDYVLYSDTRGHGIWGHLDPSRISVPRYQNIFRICVWLFFLLAYSQAVREPLDRLDPRRPRLDGWEYILYVMALSFTVEDLHKIYKLLRFVTWRAFGFWNVVSFVTDALLSVALVLRVAGITSADEGNSAVLRLRSFQVLSFVSPLIWLKLLTIFDGYKYVGTMQICVARMLQESGIFFALLSILGIGFAQGLYALDMADGEAEHASSVINVMIQALLQSPNFDKFNLSTAGLALYYLWTTATVIILLNVLISLFSSAYEDVVTDAEAEFLAFFAGQTISMIRAPDEYMYPAPFNMIEFFLIAPFEWVLSAKTYNTLNRFVMRVIFFLPLTLIALHESANEDQKKSWTWISDWFGDDAGMTNGSEVEARDPTVDEDAEQGMVISRVPFAELIKVFPDSTQSSEAKVLKEIRDLRSQIDALMQKLDGGR